MDIKIEIKEEESLSDDVASQNETVFSREVTVNRNSDAVLLDNDCDVAIKKEIKSEIPFANQIEFETVICSNNWEIDKKTEIEQQTLVSDFGTENKREFLPEDPVMKDKKFNIVHETDNKLQIKVEPWWLETGASSGCDEIKDGDFPQAKSSRLCTEVISEANSHKSPLPSAEVSGREASFNSEKDPLECERQKGDITEMPTAEDFSEQSGGECRERWSSLHECYHKSLRNKKTKSGQEATTSNPWWLEQQMEFMRPFLGNRQQLSNISQEEGVNNNNTEDDSECDTQSAASSPSSSGITSKKRSRTPVISSIDVIKQYIDYKRRINEADHLTKFFQAAEGTVRTFPPYLQIEAKKKISDLLYELEIKPLQ